MMASSSVNSLDGFDNKGGGDVDPPKFFEPLKTIEPLDDFNAYVNGEWESTTTIPDDQTDWGTLHILNEENTYRIKQILEEIEQDNTHPNYPIGVMYKRFLSFSESEEEKILNRLCEYIDVVDRVKNLEDLGFILGMMCRFDINPLFSVGAHEDAKESTIVRLTMSIPRLSLPERDYYLIDKLKKQYVDKFEENIQSLLNYLTENNIKISSDSKDAAKKIVKLETSLASMIKPAEERKESDKLYCKISIDGFVDLMSDIGDNIEPTKKDKTTKETLKNMWFNFFNQTDLRDVQDVIVYDISYMRKLSSFLIRSDLSDILLHIKYLYIRRIGSLLIEQIDRICFTFFGNVLQGQTVISDRSKRVVENMNILVGDILSKEYSSKHFNNLDMIEVRDMITSIVDQLKISIINSSWMSEDTKKAGLLKLDAMRVKIGCPSEWKDHSKLIKTMYRLMSKDTGVYAVDLVLAIKMYNYDIEVLQEINKPQNPHKWSMNAHEVNAYYDLQRNEMVFPAGILQKPLFSRDSSIFENYGTIGCIIGHEITHGYDDQGRKYDHKGNLKDWWTKGDLKNFLTISNKMVDQYSKYTIQDMNINGQLTLGENLADLGGVVLAFRAMITACKKKNINVTINDKRTFFMRYATIWKKMTRPEKMTMRLLSDPHSPGKFRVFILRNIEEFYQAFCNGEEDCSNKKLYLEKEKRIVLW